MSFQKITGYFDASGAEETVSDTVIVVAGYLAEAEQWCNFSDAWLTALKEGNVPIGSTLPVFHTTDFHARRKGFADRTIWTGEKCDPLYEKLIDIINSHTLYPVGIAVSLVDCRKLLAQNPALVLAFQKVGSFASALVFWHCAQWAERNHYNDFITYIFDRGDKFRTEITNAHQTACKSEEMNKSWRIKRDELKFENKEIYNPIQAADVLAWELAKTIKEGERPTIETESKSLLGLENLVSPEADFKFYKYEDLEWFWSKFAPMVWEEVQRRNEKEHWFDSELSTK